MKLSAFVAIAAVIGGSFLIPGPAEARNGWLKAACANNGTCYYIKPIQRNYPLVTFKSNTPHGSFNEEADCQQHRIRYVNQNGTKDNWKDAMPGSIGEGVIEMACR